MRRLPRWVRYPQLLVLSPYYATLTLAFLFGIGAFFPGITGGLCLVGLFVALGLNRVWTFRFQIFGMGRHERARWYEATDLVELGRLMVEWLEGSLFSRPAYTPGEWADRETNELMDALIAANLAGFLTDNSQPGMTHAYGKDLDGCDCHTPGVGWVYEQRAAVSGFADEVTALRLAELARKYHLEYVAQQAVLGDDAKYHLALPVSRNRYEGNDSITAVTTVFGAQIPASDLQQAWDVCSPEARGALTRAWQVTIVDPVWGRDDEQLWAVLSELGQPTAVQA